MYCGVDCDLQFRLTSNILQQQSYHQRAQCTKHCGDFKLLLLLLSFPSLLLLLPMPYLSLLLLLLLLQVLSTDHMVLNGKFKSLCLLLQGCVLQEAPQQIQVSSSSRSGRSSSMCEPLTDQQQRHVLPSWIGSSSSNI
jgi:hypothetical protein